MEIDNILDQYISENSGKEDEILSDLYRQTYLKIYHPRMISGHIQGKFLEMISRMIIPEKILEVGTYTGYSAICMAKGLSAGGQLITIDKNDEIIDSNDNPLILLEKAEKLNDDSIILSKIPSSTCCYY